MVYNIFLHFLNQIKVLLMKILEKNIKFKYMIVIIIKLKYYILVMQIMNNIKIKQVFIKNQTIMIKKEDNYILKDMDKQMKYIL